MGIAYPRVRSTHFCSANITRFFVFSCGKYIAARCADKRCLSLRAGTIPGASQPPSPFSTFSNGNLKTPQFSIFNFQLSISPAEKRADKQCLSLRAGIRADVPKGIRFASGHTSVTLRVRPLRGGRWGTAGRSTAEASLENDGKWYPVTGDETRKAPPRGVLFLFGAKRYLTASSPGAHGWRR